MKNLLKLNDDLPERGQPSPRELALRNSRTRLSALLPVILLFALLNAVAADKPALTVAVYDFVGEPDAIGYGSKVTTLVTANLTTETNLVMIERADLTKALGEQAFGMSGMVSSEAAAKIGQITGAKALVTGHVIQTKENRVAIVARIVGTETGRLFSETVEGPAENVMELTSDLSRKIASTISNQRTNLLAPVQESGAERIERIIAGINGTNRPSVSVSFVWPSGRGHAATAEGQLGVILLKAGFPVVDEKSDHKPDIVIEGVVDPGAGPRRGNLFSYRTVIELKVQERRTGTILTFDRQEATATAATKTGASRDSQALAVDGLAERILPMLAK